MGSPGMPTRYLAHGSETSCHLQPFATLNPPTRGLDVLALDIDPDELPSEHEAGSRQTSSTDLRVKYSRALPRQTL